MPDKINMVNRGNVIKYNGELWQVMSMDHVKPGKGPAFYQIKLRNLTKGGVISQRFNSNAETEIAYIETHEMEYLYAEGEDFVFMNTSSYEQHTVSKALIGDDMQWVRPNQTVSVKFFEGNPIIIDLPPSVVLKVIQCDAAARGDTVRNVTKLAKLETGAEVRVPAFIEAGEWIEVDTRNGECSGRASKDKIPE
jgi:elongation factor P